jgi:hypothetical protein
MTTDITHESLVKLGFNHYESKESNGIFDIYTRQLNACQNGFLQIHVSKNNSNISIVVNIKNKRRYTRIDPLCFGVDKNRPQLSDVDSVFQEFSGVECSIFDPIEA